MNFLQNDDKVQKSRMKKSFSVANISALKQKNSKDGNFVCPVAPPKKTAKVTKTHQNLPKDQVDPDDHEAVKLYECLRCKASGSYATVAEHLQARHGITGKITFGVDFVEHLSDGKFAIVIVG